MINSGRRVLVVLGLVAACQQPGRGAQPLQGVVEYEERDLAFEVMGRLTEVAVHEGDILPADALIARIAPDLEQNALSAREGEARAASAELALLRAGSRPEDIRAFGARLDAARASESLARTTAARAHKLFAAQATPRTAVDQGDADLARATANRRAAEEAMQAAQHGARRQDIRAAVDRADAAHATSDLQRARLSRYELRALEPGEVLEVHFKTAEIAVAGVPVVTVADTSRPYADVFVPQDALGRIRAGAPAHGRVDALPREISGFVERVARRTEFTPRYLFSPEERANLVVRVRVRFNDPGRALHAGVPIFVQVDDLPGDVPDDVPDASHPATP